jgi:hypothetical protein
MTHYLMAYLNQARFEDVTLVSPVRIAELWATPSYLPADKPGTYAMGWYVGDAFDSYVRRHWGNIINFSSYIAVAPEAGWGVVVLANADHPALVSPAVVEKIGPGVLSMLLGEALPESANIVPQLYIATFVIVELQLLSLVWAIFRMRCWIREPGRRPRGILLVGLRVIVPVLLNLLVAYVFVIGTSLAITLVLTLDWGIGFLLGGVLGLAWLLWGITALVVLRRVAAPAQALGLRTVSSHAAN